MQTDLNIATSSPALMRQPEAAAHGTPSLQALVRKQQSLDALCAATLRALSGQSGLHYRGRKLWQGHTLLPSFAPHLHPQADAAPASDSPVTPAAIQVRGRERRWAGRSARIRIFLAFMSSVGWDAVKKFCEV